MAGVLAQRGIRQCQQELLAQHVLEIDRFVGVSRDVGSIDVSVLVGLRIRARDRHRNHDRKDDRDRDRDRDQ